MANGRFLLWLKNVLKINTVPGYTADFDKTRGDSVFIDNSNRVMEVNNLQEGLTPTIFNGLKASVLDGSSQYWQLALPSDLSSLDVTANSCGWIRYGSSNQGTYSTTESGSTSCRVFTFTGTTQGFYKSGLTIGKKYKVVTRYKSTMDMQYRSSNSGILYKTLSATAEWNTTTIIFTAVSADIFCVSSTNGIFYIESITIKEDQGLDANQDQERILHSKNAEFERTLVTTYASNFSAGVDGWANYINTSVAGNIDNISGENDCLEVTVTNSASTPRIQKNISGLANGKRYVLKFRTFTNSAASVPYQVYTGNVQQTILTATKISNMWQTHEVGFLCTGTDGSGLLEINFTGSTSDKWYLKDFIIQEIPNLFTNGTFVDGTNWLREEPATQTFADGVCHFVNTTLNYSIYADAVNRKLINGKRYRLSFQILNYISGGLKTGGTGVPVSPGFTANGVHTFDFTYSGSNGTLYISAFATGTTLDLDNLHCYEIPEWSPSFAPVSGNNHYCDISTLDKASGTQSQKITASGAGRGAEALTNPDITGSATGWTINGTTCQYGTNNLVFVNAVNASSCANNADLVIGKTYEITYTITVTSGNVKFRLGTGNAGTARTASGTYVEIQTCATTTKLFVDPTNFSGTLESASVKEFLGEITLPTANLEPLVAGKKYTLEGKARLDPASLSYGANLLSGDGTSGWNVGNGTGGVVSDEYVLASTGTGYLFRSVNSPNNILKVTFKAKADTYTGKIDVYQQSNTGIYAASTPNLTSTYQTFVLYLTARSTQQTFYIQLQSTHTGNVYFDDITIQAATPVTITNQIGTKSVNSGALSIVQGSFTKFVLNFEATASEVNADWKSYLSGQGAVFVDGLSLTQRFDYASYVKFKNTKNYSTGGIYTLIAGQSAFNGGSNGISLALTDNETIYLTTTETHPNSVFSSDTTPVTTTEWCDYLGVIKGDENQYLYKNGVLKDSDSVRGIGKLIVSALAIGKTSFGAYYFGGLVATLLIIRFDNISKTNFNPNTYQPGDAITDLGGGVPEVVLWQDWSNIVGAIAMDKYRPETTRRNDLTAYGSPLASTNIVTIKDFSPQTKKLRQGTQSKQPIYSTVEGFSFDGTDDILEAGASLGSIKTVILKLKANNLELGQDILQLSATAKLTLNTDGTITATGWTSPTVKIQNTLLADSAITPNNDFLVAVKSSTAITADAFKVGGSTTYFNGKIRKVAVFTTELDDPTIQKIFKSIRSI